MAPVRIQLSRRKDFDLQALSRKFNDRDAVNVARPGKWGNPFIVNPRSAPGNKSGAIYICVPTVEDAVECFREMMTCEGEAAEKLRSMLPELRGKNLACWCKLGARCHADVLLELANGPVCEVVE